MRKLTVLILLCCGAGMTMAQSDLRSKVMTGVPVNAQVKQVPIQLIQAFAAGDLVGYYPNATDTATYKAMLSHFGLFEEAVTHFEGGCEKTKVKVPLLIRECMSMEFDLIETATFNSNTQSYEKKPEAVQIVFSASCPDNLRALEQDAVLFKISDIDNLPKGYELVNVKNDAEILGVGDILNLKLYDALPVKHGTWLNDPKNEGKKVKVKIVEDADELQDH